MHKTLQRLFPQPSIDCDLQNLYLREHGWFEANRDKPAVVANFVSSVDGRIAIEGDNGLHLPKQLTSNEDFCLFLELHAQADCLITHGGYLRTLAEKKLGNILQLPENQECTELFTWRKQQGLARHADIIIASASLDFPIHPSIKECGQKVLIATGNHADKNKIKKWQDTGYEVIKAGKNKFVEGKPLIQALGKRDYRHIYLIAGPKMLHTMIKDQQLSKIYLSFSHQLLGGEQFKTFADGELFEKTRLKLISLHYDAQSDNKCGQFFSSYECIYNY